MFKGIVEMEQEFIKLWEDGFFDDCDLSRYADKNGKIDINYLINMFIGLGASKYTMKYYLIHNEFGNPWVRLESREEDEKIYKELLEEGITWEDKFGKPSKDIIL